MKVTWSILKQFTDDRSLSIQYVETDSYYYLKAIDDFFQLEHQMDKNPTDDNDVVDFENNYKLNGNQKLDHSDPDTGGVQFTPRFAPVGWSQQIFELEFETSKENTIHEKDYMNNDIGWASLKFYKDDNGSEVECTDQADIDANCIRTDIEWMPDMDYMIKGGWIAQIESPTEDIFVWGQGAVLPDAYGGPQVTFAEGGINMAYQNGRTKAGLDGVAGTILYYDGHPQLPAGTGTNKLRFVCRHNAGVQHRFQIIFDIFRA